MSWALWITGLPGSGKSVLARSAAAALRERGEPVVHLELDALRKTLTPAPTYSATERELVYRALVYIAAALTEAGVPVIVDATGHRRAWRDLARATIARFAEVQLVCPLDVCREREARRAGGYAPPGIYARAGRAGATVPGVDVAYEPALAPELTLDTARHDPAASVAAILDLARGLARAPRAGGSPAAGGWAIWITGLPGSGKTTLAWGAAEALAERGIPIRVLDLADLRRFVLGDRPESDAARELVHRALAGAAKLLTEAGVPVIVDATASRRAWREMARQLIAHFAEVQLVCPRELCVDRERAVRWCLAAGGVARRGAPGTVAAPDVAPDYEHALAPELTLRTDRQDAWSAIEAVLRLAHQLHRSASGASHR
ncbi:MAG: adenylyl-sulfate kinase [Candidatus Rokubacteria bacterium]|nr:adenylyl-sulfate kinase [Candidatus Rokubacteria bacterium]